MSRSLSNMPGAGEERSVDGTKDKDLLADSVSSRKGARSRLNSSGVSSVTSAVSTSDSDRRKRMKKKKNVQCSKKSKKANSKSTIKSEILKGKQCEKDIPKCPTSHEIKKEVSKKSLFLCGS